MMFSKDKLAMLTAEFIGASLLTLSYLALDRTTGILFFAALGAALTYGFIIMLFGPVSGGHANPAVTFGLWTAKRIETTQAIAYIAVQLLGGLAAWRLFEFLADTTVRSKGATFDATIWLAELIGTALLVFAVTAILSRGLANLQSSVVAGSGLFVGILVASVASFGLLNPAVALGLRSWSVAYVLGPLLGGVIGANLYMLLFAPRRTVAVEKASRSRTATAHPATSSKRTTARKKRT